jgi:hypothetical protein
MKKLLTILFAVAVLSACNNHSASDQSNSKEYKELKKMEWLLGNWEFEIDNGLFAEQWEVLNDSTYTGYGYMIIGEDTVSKELISIEEVKSGELWYGVTVSDQNEGENVRFKLVSSENNQFVFENKDHDYPQVIRYIYIDNESFTAVVEGLVEGEMQKTELFMSRVK